MGHGVDAGVVDEDVEAAIFFHHQIDDPLGLLGFRDVAGNFLDLPAGGADAGRDLGKLVGGAGGDGDRRARGRERLRDRAAKALRGARDEGHLFAQVHLQLLANRLRRLVSHGHLPPEKSVNASR